MSKNSIHTQADKRIRQFADKGTGYRSFLYLAAQPLLFSTDLLYKLWLNFSTYATEDDAPCRSYLVVSDLILSGICRPVGVNLFSLDDDIREQLHKQLDTDNRKAVAKFVYEYAEHNKTRLSKNIYDVHRIWAMGVIAPFKMEKEIKEKITGEASTDYEKVNYLSLYFNSMPLDEQGEQKTNITLQVAESVHEENVLNVRLPMGLRDRIDISNLSTEPISSLNSIEIAKKLIEKEKIEKTGRLDLGRCGLTDLDAQVPELFDLIWLKKLILSNRYFDNDKDEWIVSTNEGTKNKLTDISKNFKQLHLEYLYIGGDIYNGRWDIQKIENLPADIQTLYISHNKISKIENLPADIQALYISYNKISKIENLPADLQTLFISSNQISKIENLPADIQTLFISSNQISKIENLPADLQALDISYNQISKIENLLADIQTLDISSNKISKIENLPVDLQTLFIRYNQISKIENLPADIQTLDISDNQISKIENLPADLQTLFIRYNQISKIENLPADIQTLEISYNQITDLKPLLPLIRKGVEYTISGNSTENPPMEVVKQGNESILHYFEELENKGVAYLNEAKLIIVGEGGVGKTSLFRKLEKDDAALPEEEGRTHGIDVLRLPIAGKNNTSFYMNVWDFGGQDIYHDTHRFFLTRRSLYVLMTDTRRDDDNFDYWIPLIRLYAGDSPILVVNNKRDGFPRQVSIGAFRKNEAFNIQDTVYEVNLKNGEGVARLKEDICHHIQQLPLVGNPVPKTWVQVREALNELSQTTAHISYQDFEGICHDKGIDEVLKIEDLGKYLHDLGVVLWYHDIAALKHRVILQPTWATNAVYLIIEDTKIQESYGHFDGSDIARIWASPTYARMQDELLALMQTFRLCYQKTQREAYIIPSMLRPDADFDWQERDNVRLYYEYEFMPKGLVNQLTAELHRLIPDGNQVWSRGVVLERDGTQVKIEEIRKDKRLTFHAKGLMPGALLQEVAGRLEDLHLGYPGIHVEKVVPCPCHECINNDEPTLFYYKKLITWLTEGKNPIRCNESQEDIDIRLMLNSIGVNIQEPLDLLSSTNGKITSLLVTLPYKYLKKDDEPYLSYLNVVGELTEKFDNTQLVLLAETEDEQLNEKEQKKIDEIKSRLRNNSRILVSCVRKADDNAFSIWSQDAFLIANSKNNPTPNLKYLINPAGHLRNNRRNDGSIANGVIAELSLGYTLLNFPMPIEAGNLLVADDFILVGQDEVIHSQMTSSRFHKEFQLFFKNEKPLIAVSVKYTKAKGKGGLFIIENDGNRLYHDIYRWRGKEQPLFHIDLFVTLLGRNVKGKQLIMIGEPVAGFDVNELDSDTRQLFDYQFNDVKERITECLQNLERDLQKNDIQYEILKNPLPMTYYRYGFDTSWYWASYNNCLVEITPTQKTVWLPRYGTDTNPQNPHWNDLKQYDEQQVDLLGQLGFKVHLFNNDFHFLASKNGSLRSMTKCLDRS